MTLHDILAAEVAGLCTGFPPSAFRAAQIQLWIASFKILIYNNIKLIYINSRDGGVLSRLYNTPQEE